MLRIEDAKNKTFTKTHLREGYELSEVDEFRSDVVEAITLRERVISELQEQLAGARMHLADAAVQRAHADDNPRDDKPRDDSPREGAVAAARMLELAAVTADQLVAEAKAEASSLVSAAQAEADQLVAEAKAETSSLVSAAHAEAEELTTASRSEADRVAAELARDKEQQAAELDQQRITVLAEVAHRKSALEAKVEMLRQLENEHRSHLRYHFSEQLAQLEDDAPAMLRSVVAD